MVIRAIHSLNIRTAYVPNVNDNGVVGLVNPYMALTLWRTSDPGQSQLSWTDVLIRGQECSEEEAVENVMLLCEERLREIRS